MKENEKGKKVEERDDRERSREKKKSKVKEVVKK